MIYYLSKWQNQYFKNLGKISLKQMFAEIEKENGNCTSARMMGKRFAEYSQEKNQCAAYTIGVVMTNPNSAKQDPENDQLNGLIYLDIDAKDHKGKTKDELENILASFEFVGPIWDSFSGEGLAGIAYTKGPMNKENYTATHKYIRKEFELMPIHS